MFTLAQLQPEQGSSFQVVIKGLATLQTVIFHQGTLSWLWTSLGSFFHTPLCVWIDFPQSLGCSLWLLCPAQLLCMGSPKEVRCPVAFQHLSSPTGTKELFLCLGKLQLKNDMRAVRRILTAEREQYWKGNFPAWQAAGSVHCNLPPVTFHRLQEGERSWGGRIIQCVFTVIYQVWG